MHATAKTEQKEYLLVTTLPGFSAIKSWQAFHHDLFNGLKQPLSKGCVKCVVFGGNVKRITFSLAAKNTVPRQL